MSARRPLPPLHHRATRVMLLAWSYEDATEAGSDGAYGGKFDSKRPGRFDELWDFGSYPELEKAMDALRRLDVPRYNTFWRVHVRGAFNDAIRVHPRFSGLEWVTDRMPASIFVPEPIAMSAGYLPSEAHSYTARRRRAA